MKSILSASHLLRRYALFGLTVIFTLTLVRAVLSLWQFPLVVESGALVELFVTGLRYDVALVGAMLLLPVIVVTFLAMFGATRHIATFLLVFWLSLCLLYVFATELITPYFIQEQGIRPDLEILASTENPLTRLTGYLSARLLPAVIGVSVAVLIFVAFVMRLEISRLLRYRLSRPSGLALIVFGALLCLLAIVSQVDLREPPLSPTTGLISTEQTVNEIAMNTGYKFAYSTLQPYGARVRGLLDRITGLLLIPAGNSPTSETESGAATGTGTENGGAATSQ